MESNDFAGYAGFWIRAWATLIDIVLLLVIILAVVLPIYGPEEYLASESTIRGPVDFLVSWVFPVAAVILLWKYKSATPGKMLLSLKIVDAETGGPLSIGQCVGRYFAYMVSTFPLGLGFLWIAFDRRKQAWHDKLAGTVVIRCRPLKTPVRFA